MKSIVVKYLGETTCRPARLVASDNDGNRMVVSKESIDRVTTRSGSVFDEVALRFARMLHWTGRMHGGSLSQGKYVYVFENLDPIEVTDEND